MTSTVLNVDGTDENEEDKLDISVTLGMGNTAVRDIGYINSLSNKSRYCHYHVRRHTFLAQMEAITGEVNGFILLLHTKK